MHTDIHTYIHTYMHTYIHTYIHAYIHSFIHAYTYSLTNSLTHATVYAAIQTIRATWARNCVYLKRKLTQILGVWLSTPRAQGLALKSGRQASQFTPVVLCWQTQERAPLTSLTLSACPLQFGRP